MAQQIKVQDGNIIYETSDPANYDVNFDIKGVLSVTKDLIVGDDLLAGGTITTATGQNLTLTTGIGGNLNLAPDGSIILNGIQWPTGASSVTPGSYLGASALNTLTFYPFILANTGSDTLTVAQLNIAYPTIQPGQSVIGPSVVYQCISSGQWRTLGASLGYTPVNKAGDTMSGLLILSADPVAPLGAVTKQYADQIVGANNAIVIKTINTDYTLILADAYNTLIRITKATPAIVTIPNDTTANLPIGSAVLIGQNAAGTVTISPAVGVTIDTPDTYVIGKQYGKITAIKVGSNHWEIEGNLVPS